MWQETRELIETDLTQTQGRRYFCFDSGNLTARDCYFFNDPDRYNVFEGFPGLMYEVLEGKEDKKLENKSLDYDDIINRFFGDYEDFTDLAQAVIMEKKPDIFEKRYLLINKLK